MKWISAVGEAGERARALVRDPDAAGGNDHRARPEPEGSLACDDAPRRVDAQERAGVVVRDPKGAAAGEPDGADADAEPRNHTRRRRVDADQRRAAEARRPDLPATGDRVVGIRADRDLAATRPVAGSIFPN